MGADGSHSTNVPPPFLTKTYEMVDDPMTDGIVSWSENNNSFVVWNVADFTKDLLPQFFKHNNFSSFVRQLNTYGFHKIDPERQEFANEGFSKGNKEALKNIHRRKPTASHPQTSSAQKELSLVGCSDPAHAEFEEEIRALKQDKGLLVNELMKMRELQESTETKLEALGHRLQVLEKRQHGIVMVVAHAMHHPFIAQFLQKSESLAFNKKRRLPEQEALIGIGDSWVEEEGHGQLVSSGLLSNLEGPLESEASYEYVLKQLAGSTLNQPEETSPLSQTSKVSVWEMPATGGEHVPNVDSAEHGEAPLESRGSGHLGTLDSNALHLNICGNEGDHDEQKAVHLHGSMGSEVKKNKGSNDVFWENMLTENPQLPDRSSEDCRSDCRVHERWFL